MVDILFRTQCVKQHIPTLPFDAQALCVTSPGNIKRNKHVIIITIRRFDVTITFLLCFMFAEWSLLQLLSSPSRLELCYLATNRQYNVFINNEG